MDQRRRATTTVLVLFLLAGCSTETGSGRVERATVTVRPDAEPQSVVAPERSGFFVRENTFAVAATFRSSARHPIGDVEIAVELMAEDGSVLTSFGDSLPFCPPDERCWWATRFPASEFGPKLDEVADVRVRVTADGGRYTSAAESGASMRSFPVHRGRDGFVSGHAPSREGMVFVIGERASFLGGVGINVFSAEPRSRNIHVPPDLLPDLGPRERLRAIMYSFDLPEGS